MLTSTRLTLSSHSQVSMFSVLTTNLLALNRPEARPYLLSGQGWEVGTGRAEVFLTSICRQQLSSEQSRLPSLFNTFLSTAPYSLTSVRHKLLLWQHYKPPHAHFAPLPLTPSPSFTTLIRIRHAAENISQ